MYEHHRAHFDRLNRGSKPRAAVWKNMPDGYVRFAGHPTIRRANWRDRVKPLRLHGDGVPVGKARGRTVHVL